VKNTNPPNIIIGVTAALIYAILGYTAQDQPFNPKKFLRTVLIAAIAAFSLDVTGLMVNVYAAALEPTAITMILQKIIDSAKQT
jgi:hypothetical protein